MATQGRGTALPPALCTRMEPAGWVIDKVGDHHEDFSGGNGKQPKRQPGLDNTQSPRSTSTYPSTACQQPTADTVAADDDDRGEAPSHNSVDELLRRIARDVSARQAREDKSDFRREDCGNHESGSQRRRQQPSPTSGRKSRWSTISERRHGISGEEHEGSSRKQGGGAGNGAESEKAYFGTAPAPAAATAPAADSSVSVAEANPFTESMWEDASCRQVLQATFFSPGSAVPAGSTEEYKELEGAEHTYGRTYPNNRAICHETPRARPF